MSGRKYAIILIILALIAIVVVVYTPKTSVPSSNAFVIQMTDPPQVPNGTQSLVISYSGISLHEAGNANSTGFVYVAQSGSINLMQLVNFTQTIAVAKKTGAAFDMVRFNITGATITINGNTYNVSVPNNRLLVKISGSNSTSGGVLVEVNPTVLQIYSGNQTIFVMVPSARAVAIGGSIVNSTSASVGFRGRLKASEHEHLKLASSNISITSAAISQVGNSTRLSITVRNNANTSAVLKHVLVYGYMQTIINALASNTDASAGLNISAQMPYQDNSTSAAGSSNRDAYGSVGPSYTQNVSGIVSELVGGSSSGAINISTLAHLGAAIGMNMNLSSLNLTSANTAIEGLTGNLSDTLHYLQGTTGINANDISSIEEHNTEIYSTANEILGVLKNYSNNRISETEARSMVENLTSSMGSMNNASIREIVAAHTFSDMFHNVLGFIVMPDGTLSLPFDAQEIEGSNGYTLAPGSNVTLTFYAPITIGPSAVHSDVGPKVYTSILINQTYSIRVIGEEGAFAEINVTSS